MALDYDKVDVSTGLSTATRLNAELEKIQTALQDGLSRSGTGPNEMSADLSLGGNDLLNVGVVQCDAITVGGEQIASVAELAAEADRAEAAADDAEAAQLAAEGARDAAILAASSLSLPTISGGDAGKALIVNATEDGYEYSNPVDPAVAIAAARADQSTAEAGTDNDTLMTPLRTAQAVAAQILDGDYEATTSAQGTVELATPGEVGQAWRAESPFSGADQVLTLEGLVSAMTTSVSTGPDWGVLRLAGLTIQWGRYPRSGNSTLVEFNWPFNSAVLLVIPTSEDTNNRVLSGSPALSTITLNDFRVRHGTDFTHVRWLAIGY